MPGTDDMKAPSPRVKLTYEDFLLFPDDGKRHELIDGEHYVTPSPNTKHQTVCGNLHFLFRARLEAHPVGRVFFCALRYRLHPVRRRRTGPAVHVNTAAPLRS